MDELPDVSITKEEAKVAIVNAAFTVKHEHCETCTCKVPPREQKIHCRLGGVGADWSVEGALELIDEATEIVWTTSFLRHDLLVLARDRIYQFEVARPERGVKTHVPAPEELGHFDRGKN